METTVYGGRIVLRRKIRQHRRAILLTILLGLLTAQCWFWDVFRWVWRVPSDVPQHRALVELSVPG